MLSMEKEMKKLLLCTAIATLFLSGCAAIGQTKNSATAVNGLQTDNNGHYQYVKNYPVTGQTAPEALKLQQCAVAVVSGAEGGANGTATGSLYTTRGTTSYRITSLGNPVTFVVGYTLNLSTNSGGIRYVFTNIRQAQSNTGSLTNTGPANEWVGSNPQQTVAAFTQISDQINHCLSS